MMKHVWFMLFLCCGLNTVAQIMVSEPAKDLGDIYESRGKVTTFFSLTNPYKNDTIHILNIETSCGCTAILTQDTLIYPGQTISLELSYNPEGRLGLFVKSIAVVSRTGNHTASTLYLKISGNVVSEHSLVKPVNTALLEYKVAPIFFYPVTAFDTSYLDFSYIISFVNDLTYEIDFYQFTTIGIEISVSDKKYIEDLEYLLNFSRAKLIREFKSRGFFPSTIFFDEPIFKISEIPVWSTAKIKLFSTNFNTDISDESIIKITKDEFVENTNLVLDYQRFSLPEWDELLKQINFEALEGKLFMNSSLQLKGLLQMPKSVPQKDRDKFAKKFNKKIFKYLKKSNGISKHNVTIEFDSVSTHPEDKYRFVMWDKGDEQDQQVFRYEVKQDDIVPPLLPTYKQSMLTRTTIDTSNLDFKRFWKNILQNHKAGQKINLVIESSVSQIPRNTGDDNLVIARKRANEIGQYLTALFEEKTGRTLTFQIKPIVHGPAYTDKLKKHVDYAQYEYINIIPTTHANGPGKELNPHPYQVNFDYYFNGVDTASWLFDKFATYLAQAVEQDGYVELRLESSISQVPIQGSVSNDFLLYSRAHESEKRLRHYVKTKLIDDNRIIFTEVRYLVQGPEYDGTIPILQFRKFQYIKIVPQKVLTQE